MTAGLVRNLFLTGFMGAGKTTTGKALAEVLHCDFVDLDKVIVAREKRAINEIFATDGETYFRDCETKLLRELSPVSPAVYATGGGIVQREENRDLMKGCGLIIYLNARWESLQQRLTGSTDRPLAGPGKDWEAVRQLWNVRQPMYRDADLMVETDDQTPEQVANRIVILLKQKAYL